MFRQKLAVFETILENDSALRRYTSATAYSIIITIPAEETMTSIVKVEGEMGLDTKGRYDPL